MEDITLPVKGPPPPLWPMAEKTETRRPGKDQPPVSAEVRIHPWLGEHNTLLAGDELTNQLGGDGCKTRAMT